MSRRARRHGSGGRTGQHYSATPNLRSYSQPPAGPVTITRPDGTVEVQAPQKAVRDVPAPRRKKPKAGPKPLPMPTMKAPPARVMPLLRPEGGGPLHDPAGPRGASGALPDG